MAPPAEQRGPSVGILALQSGLITQKQLMECIELQRAEGGDADIGQLLVRKGYLSPGQIEGLRPRTAQTTAIPAASTAVTSKTATRSSTAQTVALPAKPGTSVRKPTGQTPAVARETSVKKATGQSPAVAGPPAPAAPQPPVQRSTTAIRPATGQAPAVPEKGATAVRKSGQTAVSQAPPSDKGSTAVRGAGQQPAVRRESTTVRPVTSQSTAASAAPTEKGATAVRKGAAQTAVRRETTASRRPSGQTTVVRKSTQVVPAMSDPSIEGTAEPAPVPHRRGFLAGVALAGIPVLILGAFLAYRWAQKRRPAASPRTQQVRSDPTPRDGTEARDPETDRKPGPVRLFRLDDDSDVARRWNHVVGEIGDGGPETYARYFREIQLIVADAKGTRHESRLQRIHDDMLRSIEAYAGEVFAFVGDQSATLAKAGKYAEAVTAWDWFPNVIDPTGLFRDRIEENKKRTKAAGLEFYADLKKRAEESAAAGRFDEAKRLMMAALEIGFPEVTDEAFKKVAELSSRETEAGRKAEEESLAQYEKEIREQKEAGAIVESIRARFWDLLSQRKPEAAESFLKSEREKRTGEPFAAEFKLLDEVLAGFRDLFVGVAESLKGRIGQTVTLSFVDQVRTVKLKDVGAGKIVYVVEGRELTESLWKLHASELVKLSGAEAPRQAAAHLLADEFDRALDLLEGAGDRGKPLKSFIEGSSNYAAKNEAKIRERAAKFEAGREYEKAAREYSKLVAVPALRAKALKDRARAYFQAEIFVAAVLDVEQLFDMDVVDRDAVDILNKSYERSALISKAIAIYEKAAKKFPEDARVLAALVGLYMKTHDYAKARGALDNARKLKNWDPSLGSYVHLLNVDEKGAFPGKSYKIQLDRYIVETDVDQKFTNEIAQFMGTVYQNYKKVFPYKKNENLLFYVKIFNTESEFATYYQAVTGQPAARGFGKVGAYYMPLTKELVGWNASDLKSTLMHEGLHQFIDFYVDDCPSWFNEGFACIFETSTAEEWKFNKERHENAKYAMARKFLPSLRDLLLMSRAAWNGTDYTVFYYGQSWSFIYWLIKQGRRDILDKYFDELMKGRTGKQAFDAVFGDGKVNLDELEARWKLALFSDNYE